ncbi:MAG: hypothetical protein JXA99_01530 [Candidatus Lokiarchaeota archaeon]|nr:hypothetical protein [Candidatus Lokiarchaeota archaeon]
MLSFLKIFRKVSNNNISILDDIINLIESTYTYSNTILLKNEIRSLQEELELSTIRDKSSLLSAKTDFIHKMELNIEKNSEKLSFLEEDYQKIKKKKDKIEKKIQKYKEDVKELSQKKKDKFDVINKITRNMEDPDNKSNEILIEANLSNSEMIKKLRIEAKEIHNQINQTKLDLNESNEELKKIAPKYNLYKKDYDDLSSIIQKESIKLKETKIEIDKETSDNIKTDTGKINQFGKIRSSDTIKRDLNEKQRALNQINLFKNSLKVKAKEDFSGLRKKISDITTFINKNQEKIIFFPNEGDIISSIENFRDLELLTIKVEDQLNQFLLTINLKAELKIKLETKEFFIQISFIRNNKEIVKFENLTTPEKVFFVIMFYISMKIILKFKNIIFSNLFIHQNYNKRGSLFRTIEKIIPIFKTNKQLADKNLIFIISNFEMNRSISNVKLIKI